MEDKSIHSYESKLDSTLDNLSDIIEIKEELPKQSSLREKAKKAKKKRCNTFLCVLENPGNIHNVATVLRNIDSYGVSKLYIVSDDPKYSEYFSIVKPGRNGISEDTVTKSLDTTKSSGEKVKLLRQFGLKSMHDTLMNTSVSASKWVYVRCFKTTAECFAHLSKNNFTSFVTSPHVKGHENFNLNEHDFTRYKKLAIWFGNESGGISEEAIKFANGCIQIEMCGIVESLNLASCHSAVCNVVVSQRRKYISNKHVKDQSK